MVSFQLLRRVRYPASLRFSTFLSWLEVLRTPRFNLHAKHELNVTFVKFSFTMSFQLLPVNPERNVLASLYLSVLARGATKALNKELSSGQRMSDALHCILCAHFYSWRFIN